MTPPHIRFFTNGDDNENKVKERLLRWCYGLGIEVRGSVVDDDSGGAGKHFDRAARAKLRRCRKPGDALLEPAFTGFLNAVFPDRFSDIVANRQTVAGLARVAILLPHIKRVDTRRKLSAQLISSDPKKTPERPVVSELRVRVLVQEADPDEAVLRWRRLLPLLGAGVNAPELAELVFRWTEDARRQLAFDYFSGLAAVRHGASRAA